MKALGFWAKMLHAILLFVIYAERGLFVIKLIIILILNENSGYILA